MPSPTAFRRGYGIAVGDSLTIGTCTATIRESRVQHIVVREFERYEFPSKITFSLSNSSSRTTPLPKPEAVLEALIRHTCADTDATKLIYSEYGSPYQCKFGTPVLAATEDASQVVITTRGVAIRDHELPTQKQTNEALQRAGSASRGAPVDEATKNRISVTHRIVKSRFGTSACASCGELITPGDFICRAKAADKAANSGSTKKTGGWSHIQCTAASLTSQQLARATGTEEGDATISTDCTEPANAIMATKRKRRPSVSDAEGSPSPRSRRGSSKATT